MEVIETGSSVEILVTVDAAPGLSQSCQGNPSTPVTVNLDAPLGNRQLIDSSGLVSENWLPPRPDLPVIDAQLPEAAIISDQVGGGVWLEPTCEPDEWFTDSTFVSADSVLATAIDAGGLPHTGWHAYRRSDGGAMFVLATEGEVVAVVFAESAYVGFHAVAQVCEDLDEDAVFDSDPPISAESTPTASTADVAEVPERVVELLLASGFLSVGNEWVFPNPARRCDQIVALEDALTDDGWSLSAWQEGQFANDKVLRQRRIRVLDGDLLELVTVGEDRIEARSAVASLEPGADDEPSSPTPCVLDAD